MNAADAIDVVSVALRVLRTRDGIAIPSELIEERARNIVTALDLASAATLSDAAGAVAALLADPLDPDARACARVWLRAVRPAGARPAAPCPCGEGDNPLHALLAHGGAR